MSTEIDLKQTVNLPRTEFPMKANLPEREAVWLQRWDRFGLYDRIRATRAGRPRFLLHDGPPYANGNIHLGQALNKILKDLVVKSRSMMGLDAAYRPGWDCHGLPIEHRVDRELGAAKKDMSALAVRAACRAYAEKYIDVQREEFRRLGVLGEWARPYRTLDPEYEAVIVEQLASFFVSGSAYYGKKPVHWCASCRTALAEAEVEYEDHTSPSVYVRFPLEVPGLESRFPFLAGRRVSVAIWTTTPWTLPANLAVAFHPDYIYEWVDTGDELLLMARDRVEAVAKACGLTVRARLGGLPGSELERAGHARRPYPQNGRPYSELVLAEHVTLDQGTGCVHTAPGHGEEDFEIGRAYQLPPYAPLDDGGRFDGAAFDSDQPYATALAGRKVTEANEWIVEDLKARGLLLKQETIRHSYPHCWRCRNPVLFRATDQWFIDLSRDGLRERALDRIRSTRWRPEAGEIRIANMVAHRPDWCISRQRSWGVPIPIFACSACFPRNPRAYIGDADSFARIAAVFRKEGSDSWFRDYASPSAMVDHFLPAATACPGCGKRDTLRPQRFIVDVWFESGVSSFAALPPDQWPADLYLEGTDQYRGWFQSSLLVATRSRGEAPYRQVLTHGFTLDGEGRKMSKSLGNVISPQDVTRRFGADILRLWVCMVDYLDDMRLSEEILARAVEAYRKIRNTCRYLLGNLYDFDPERDAVPLERLPELDRWALHQTNDVIRRIRQAYEGYEFHRVYQALHHYCAVTLSAFYFDILKDRLYTSAPGAPERRAAQTALHRILESLTRLMAPVLTFTAEETWQHARARKESPEIAASIHQEEFPALLDLPDEPEMLARWDRLAAVREEVLKRLEVARAEKTIGNSLEAEVGLEATGELAALLERHVADLPALLIVSKVRLGAAGADAQAAERLEGLRITVRRAPGEKCERCWSYRSDRGHDAGFPTLCARCAAAVREIRGMPAR